MMKKVLLVGCGNIGSRHLQSLLQLEDSAHITIVEPNKNSRNNAKSILSDSSCSNENLEWISNISELTESYDLAIIATQSTNRPQLISQLLIGGNKKFLIEKMVCQSVNEYKKILDDFKKFQAKGWVNTNFRYFSFYQKLAKYFATNIPQKFVITGGGEKGLGSNAIHFLDLFSWFTNSNEISLNGDFLTEKLLPNKRSDNLVEFSGTIIGKNNNSSISISFLPSSEIPITVEILNSKHHIIIDTENIFVRKIRGLEDFSEQFEFQHTSELTKKIASDILQTDDCLLPSIEELYLVHSELFRIFNSHIKKLKNNEPDLCPIT